MHHNTMEGPPWPQAMESPAFALILEHVPVSLDPHLSGHDALLGFGHSTVLPEPTDDAVPGRPDARGSGPGAGSAGVGSLLGQDS